jgi:uncharacterized caspase-like protein
MNKSGRARVGMFAALAAAMLCHVQASDAQSPAVATAVGAANCPLGKPVRDAKGVARLALLVGVGAYQHESITKLTGPAHDVRLMRAVLTDTGGFGFPAANVCSLTDADATGRNFREAFRRALVDRADRGDTVVVYFAGHGMQLPDNNQDEPDLCAMTSSKRCSEGCVRPAAMWS